VRRILTAPYFPRELAMSRVTAAACVLVGLSVSPLAAAPPGADDRKTAEENLRKAQDALKKTDSSLNWLSKSLYVGSVLTKNPDLKELGQFVGEVRKPVAELKKHTDKVVELADRKKDTAAAEKESKTLLDKLKLVKLSKQAEELEKLSKRVSELPVGLVSEKVDDKFAVSADLLVKNPKEAQARFKAYLAAMKANAEYLQAKHAQLEETADVAKAAGKAFGQLRDDLEKVAPHGGLYAKTLTETYLDVDKLAKAYNGLGSDCAAKAKEAKQAVAVEKKRHDQLKTNIKTFFGFDAD
jgi:chromosome segregation ATPase